MAKFIQPIPDLKAATCMVSVRNTFPSIMFSFACTIGLMVTLLIVFGVFFKFGLSKMEGGGFIFAFLFLVVLLSFIFIMMVGMKKYQVKEEVVFKENGILTSLFGIIEYSNIIEFKRKNYRGEESLTFVMNDGSKISFSATNSFANKSLNEFTRFKENLNLVQY